MHRFLIVVLLCLLLCLPACRLLGQPEEQELPYDTLAQYERDSGGSNWQAEEPGLIVLATGDEVSQLEGFVAGDTLDQLRQVNYNTYFVIAVFLGRQPNIHEGISIEQVVRRGNEVTIYVHVGELGGETEESSPYHIVQVTKEGGWNQVIDFTSLFNGSVVASRSHFIP